MEKRKILKTIGAMVAGVMLLGTTAFAAQDYYYYGDWTLEVSQAKRSGISEKETARNSGYVSRTRPDPTSTYIGANFVNSNNAPKSKSVEIQGIGQKYASYSGYNVNSGDYLALQVWNPTEKNKGKQITAGGKYQP